MSKRRGPTPKRPWQPMAPAVPVRPESFRRTEGPHARMFKNDRYTVIAVPSGGDWAKAIWLSIRRNDRKPIHDWRHFQAIKNDIAGPEREAVELYPAESRLVDTSNQYHLWVAPEGERYQIGWARRIVSTPDGGLEADGKVMSDEEIDAQLEQMGASRDAITGAVQRER